jgi:hypothetical protein
MRDLRRIVAVVSPTLMASDTTHLTPVEREDFILATYREIAVRFGLGGPNAARTKVKRAGWRAEPSNHPADPLRVRVPQDAWYQAGETPHHTLLEMGHPKPIRDASSQKHDARHIKALEMAVTALREGLAAAEARAGRAEGRADTADADRRAAEARADRAVASCDRLEDELAKAEERARAVEADAGAWWSQSRWRRLRAAWRGREGG